MNISQISTRVLSLPVSEPFRTSRGRWIHSVGHVLVEARTNEGHVGHGYVMSLYGNLGSLRMAIEELKDLAVGRDPSETKSIWQQMVSASKWFGPEGFMSFAISAIDIALWDLLGKVSEKPLFVLLGGERKEVPCYRTGFRRSTPAGELGREAEAYLAEGFRAVKVKLGGEEDLEKEIERVKAVRSAVGDNVRLMVDPNWAWNAETALAMGPKLEEYDVCWLEDPLPIDDLAGMTRVAAGLDMPVAIGENLASRSVFLRLINHQCGDIFNLDIQRLGGISGWIEMAAFFQARNIRIAGHHLPEIQCHLISSTDNGVTVEYVPYSMGLYRQPPKIVEGVIELPQRPGIGLEIDEEAIKRYALS